MAGPCEATLRCRRASITTAASPAKRSVTTRKQRLAVHRATPLLLTSSLASPSLAVEPTPLPDVSLDAAAARTQEQLDLSWVVPELPYPYSLRESWTIPVAHSLGVMTALRVSEAILYPDPFAATDPNVWAMHYEEAFTMPPVFDTTQEPFEWDGDPWPINVVGHALLGSEMYTRMRICRHGPLVSIAFTAAGAVVWDYVFEANGVRPSGLDLVYTPLAGALLGEGRYWMWRGAATLSSPTWRTVLTIIADPLGEFGRALGTDC